MENSKQEFYEALSVKQKARVELKIRKLLRESYRELPQESINPIRYQVASDIFKILKG